MARAAESGKKSGEGGRGHPGKSSPITVEGFLKGVDFPADKKTLVQKAKSNKAPDDVMKTIEKLPEKSYSSPVDISKEIGHMR
ncbi:MAG TPA: DUF2795 domain-containing protein [Syntrophorhabdaceae bacterium]